MISVFQGLLFLREETLRGRKLTVYVMMKILKMVTQAKVTSYQIKWAVSDLLLNVESEKIDLSSAIQRVMDHNILRGKFNGVNVDLQNMGVKRVEVTEEGFKFVTEVDPNDVQSDLQNMRILVTEKDFKSITEEDITPEADNHRFCYCL